MNPVASLPRHTAVIGAGIAGLSCADHLQQAGLKAILLAAFAELGGPAPNAWTAHRWRYADTNRALDITCAWESETGMGLCGDWLNGRNVEGAWLSGQALARQVVESIADVKQGPHAGCGVFRVSA